MLFVHKKQPLDKYCQGVIRIKTASQLHRLPAAYRKAVFINSSNPSLFRALHAGYGTEGFKDDLHIQTKAEIADVFIIKLDDLLEVRDVIKIKSRCFARILVFFISIPFQVLI